MSLVFPLQKLAGFQEEIQFAVLRPVHQTLRVNQCALIKDLGVRLATINFCFQILVEKGLVKMRSFSQSKHKHKLLRYAYLLTPVRGAEKSKFTAEFLRRKVVKYEMLQAEIGALKAQMNSVKDDPQ